MIRNIIIVAVGLLSSVSASCGMSPQNVAVVVNNIGSLYGTSLAVGRYYCQSEGIPLNNLIEVTTVGDQAITQSQYASLAAQIRTALVNQLHVDPNDPANDPIQCLVMCYGIPHVIAGDPSSITSEATAVDSYLTMLFSASPDLGPDVIDGDWMNANQSYGPEGVPNPYYGKNMDFATFRALPENDTTYMVGSETRHAKMRYMVCRLGGYSIPTEQVVIDQTTCSIPRDIKALIDRAHASAGQTGRFVLDEPWHMDIPWTPTQFGTAETALKTMVDPDLVVRDGQSNDSYLNEFQDSIGVMGYASFGMHDPDILLGTDWGMPHFNWKPGAVAMIGESFGAASIRDPNHGGWSPNPNSYQLTDDAELQGKLIVNVKQTIPSDNGQTVRAFVGYRVALLSWTPGNESSDQVLTCTGGTMETVTDADGVAVLDLAAVNNWPASGKTKVLVCYPASSGFHPGEPLVSNYLTCGGNGVYPYNLQELLPGGVLANHGLIAAVGVSRQKVSDYIFDGCSAIAGPVAEPAGGWQDTNTTLIRYAKGYSWAEAAYMGNSRLGFKWVEFGDPLMAPYGTSPSIGFVDPSPWNDSEVSGRVSLCASATPTSGGSIQRVDFWVRGSVNKRVGSVMQAPYECAWDCTEQNGSGPVFPDGTYIVEAVAYQTGTHVGTSTISMTVIVDSASLPTVSITMPETADCVVTSAAPVEAEVSESIMSVEFWLFGGDDPILAGTAVTVPYQCEISGYSAPDGVYELQAIASYYNDYQSYSERRRIVLVNGVPYTTNVGGLSAVTNDSGVFLVNIPVVAGTSAADDAFYVEDACRSAGIRIESAAVVSTGTVVTVSGTLHSGTGDLERYVEASHVWVMGDCTPPKPLGMTNKSLGGQGPGGTPGITGGVGLYNTGLLVRTTGIVTYVGSDFAYVDDGSQLSDGNNLLGARMDRCDGMPVPEENPPVVGVCVNCTGLTRPGIGDQIAITGISSITEIGANSVRYIRPRNQDDITPLETYTQCVKTYCGESFIFVDSDLNPIPLDSKVRMSNAQISQVFDDHFYVQHQESFYQVLLPTLIPWPAAFPRYERVTILGVTATDSLFGQLVQPLCIYDGGSTYGALSVQLSPFAAGMDGGEALEQGGGVFRPWPSSGAEDVLASDWFQSLYNSTGNIGWVLSQPDGTVIDLTSVVVVQTSEDGRTLGLREWFEPSVTRPQLVIALENGVTGLGSNSVTVDVAGATLTTLAGGQRALINPTGVYAYVTATGQFAPPMPAKATGAPTDFPVWPWKVKIAP